MKNHTKLAYVGVFFVPEETEIILEYINQEGYRKQSDFIRDALRYFVEGTSGLTLPICK